MIKQLPVLLKRELWEHRNIFVVLPVILTAILIVVGTLSTLFMDVTVNGAGEHDYTVRDEDGTVIVESGTERSESMSLRKMYIAQLEELEFIGERERQQRIAAVLAVPVLPLTLVLWFVIFFYLLGSLYDERRDRSVLFWKSLPVSDTMTVLSKFCAGALVAPAIVYPLIVLMQLVVLLIGTVLAMSGDIDAWVALWQPARLHVAWGILLLLLVICALWFLPFFAWVMLVSGWARSVPLVWVTAVPLAVAVTEKLLLGRTWISHALAEHMMLPDELFIERRIVDVGACFDLLGSMQLWAGVLAGVAMLALTIYWRGRSDEI